MKSPLFLRGWLCAAALSTSACVSVADLPIASEDGGEELDADAEEPDASVAPPRKADASTVDASTYVDATTPDDASMHDADATIEPPIDASLKSCAKSSDCAADQACDGTQCVPRCTSYGACVVHEAEQATRILVSAGDAVYWVTGPSADALGNPRKDAELWRIVPGSTAVRLLKNLSYVEPVIKGGYLYFSQGARLYRAPLQADATVQQLYLMEGSYPSWAVGDSFLAFSSSTGIEVGSLDGAAPLAHFEVSVPADAPYISLIAGADRIYFRVSGKNELLALTMNPFVVQKTPVQLYFDTKFGPRSFVRGTTLYTECGPAGFPFLCGNDLNDGSGFTAAKVPDEAYSSGGSSWKASTSFVAGDWAYWGYYSGESLADLARFSLVSIGVSQTLFTKSLKDAVIPGQAAAAGDRLYFLPVAADMAPSRLIYEMPLPPDPCTNELRCPNGKTCGSDSFCH